MVDIADPQGAYNRTFNNKSYYIQVYVTIYNVKSIGTKINRKTLKFAYTI